MCVCGGFRIISVGFKRLSVCVCVCVCVCGVQNGICGL